MSKGKRKGSTLPPLQKLIVIHLSNAGPQTINETVKKIQHSYKPSWVAFNNLEKKGIIKKSGMKEYRNQEYPLFWLTEEGVILALIEGASPIELLTTTKQVYPENQVLQFGLEMAPHLDVEIFRYALTTVRTKGKLEPADIVYIMITPMQTDTTMEKFIQALEAYRKYPKQYKQFKQKIAEMQENFNKLVKEI